MSIDSDWMFSFSELCKYALRITSPELVLPDKDNWHSIYNFSTNSTRPLIHTIQGSAWRFVWSCLMFWEWPWGYWRKGTKEKSRWNTSCSVFFWSLARWLSERVSAFIGLWREFLTWFIWHWRCIVCCMLNIRNVFKQKYKNAKSGTQRWEMLETRNCPNHFFPFTIF